MADAAEIPAGFERVDRSVSIVFANVVSLALMPVLAAGMYALWELAAREAQTTPGALCAWMVAGAVSFLVHELLHAAGYLLGGARRSEVRIGVMWRLLTPYATCSVPLRKRSYVVAAALPGVVLGVVPMVASLLTGSPGGYVYSGVMLLGAVGDALSIFTIRDLPGDTLVLDHASRAGCIALVPRREEPPRDVPRP